MLYNIELLPWHKKSNKIFIWSYAISMQVILAPIYFSPRVIIFFILLETLTVPLVALGNSITIQNIFCSAIIGFIVAFVCVLLLLKVLKQLIIKYSQNLFALTVSDIHGILFIGLMAGMLLMIMFIVQFIMFRHGYNDFSTGLVSAFISVLLILSLYELMAKISSFGIIIIGANNTYYKIHFAYREIIYLSILFGIYEFIVCPITGIWLHFTTYRLAVAILSGALGGGIGGLFLHLVSRFTKIKLNLTLVKL